MSKTLALQVSWGFLLILQGVRLTVVFTLCKYRLIVHCVNINEVFSVQVKNKPCVECILIMRLISWNHTCGSETLVSNRQNTASPKYNDDISLLISQYFISVNNLLKHFLACLQICLNVLHEDEKSAGKKYVSQ
jgi:hypothetical protein